MKHSHLTRWTPAAIVVIAGTTNALAAGLFGASFDLSSLNGSNGFTINGIDVGDYSGWSVSAAGDINGDGIDDLVIGASRADPNGASAAGKSYVVFGSAAPFPASLDLASLNGANGFVINGIDTDDESGRSVSAAGDINGDGIDDLVIGAAFADPNGVTYAGESYVVFGSAAPFPASLELASLNGTNGFVLNGIDSLDLSGLSVSAAGDINCDGFDDLIIGAQGAELIGTIRSIGATYVVFGSAASFPPSLELDSLNGANGFVINGIDASDNSGYSVSAAGDINGDGIDDLVIGAWFADPNGDNSGESYVVFGAAVPFPASLELASLNGINGFVIHGIDADDISGAHVSTAGDINGDGVDDLVIGASQGDPNGAIDAGETYVVFGGVAPFPASLELASLNGANGFVINGIDADDRSGISVSVAGDINGDGVDDLVIGANLADPNGASNAGETYIVFGGVAPFPASLELASLNGANGFVINGIDVGDYSGWSVSAAGDMNGDGVDDLVIGGPGADPNGVSEAGETYVIFGRAPCPGDLNADGVVDTADLGILLAQFNTPGPGADINGDGTVDTADLGILLGAFGTTTCP